MFLGYSDKPEEICIKYNMAMSPSLSSLSICDTKLILDGIDWWIGLFIMGVFHEPETIDIVMTKTRYLSCH